MAHWASGVDRKPCDECRAVYTIGRRDTKEDKARKAGGPPCATCRPTLMPENAEAWNVYQRCQGQLIMSYGGPVDINILAVLAMIDLLGIEDRLDCLEKVQAVAGKIIAEQHEEAERQRKEQAG